MFSLFPCLLGPGLKQQYQKLAPKKFQPLSFKKIKLFFSQNVSILTLRKPSLGS